MTFWFFVFSTALFWSSFCQRLPPDSLPCFVFDVWVDLRGDICNLVCLMLTCVEKTKHGNVFVEVTATFKNILFKLNKDHKLLSLWFLFFFFLWKCLWTVPTFLCINDCIKCCEPRRTVKSLINCHLSASTGRVCVWSYWGWTSKPNSQAVSQMFSITSGGSYPGVKFRGFGRAAGNRSLGSSPLIEQSGKNSIPFWAAQYPVPTTLQAGKGRRSPSPPVGFLQLCGTSKELDNAQSHFMEGLELICKHSCRSESNQCVWRCRAQDIQFVLLEHSNQSGVMRIM